jgi:hypothetical protein
VKGRTERIRRQFEQLAASVPPEPDPAQVAFDNYLDALSSSELAWVTAPVDQAEANVPCDHVESISCGCRGEERLMRGFAAFPELHEVHLLRQRKLMEAHGFWGSETERLQQEERDYFAAVREWLDAEGADWWRKATSEKGDG